jgi:hypothetical protein
VWLYVCVYVCVVTQAYGAQLPARFLDMPGHVTGISFHPSGGGGAGAKKAAKVKAKAGKAASNGADAAAAEPMPSCMVHTPGAFAYVDFARPPSTQLAEEPQSCEEKKKGRTPKPAPAPQCTPLHAALHSTHALHHLPAAEGDAGGKKKGGGSGGAGAHPTPSPQTPYTPTNTQAVSIRPT